MKTKLLYGAIILLFGYIAYLNIQNYALNSEIETLEKTVFDMQESAKTELKKVRDGANTAINLLTANSLKKVDTILIENTKIKYVPFEKYIYANRTVDAAIDTLAVYTYETAKEKN